jgi:hypothetical protein
MILLSDEYVIPALGLLSSIAAWLINDSRNKVEIISKDHIQLNLEIEALKIHKEESNLKRQADLDMMRSLREDIKNLGEIMIELRIQLQNKQSRV